MDVESEGWYSRRMLVVGRHVLVDVWDANPKTLNEEGVVAEALRAACLEAEAAVLHTWSHAFEPQGVTAVVGLAESHASIHTYPEWGYYAADIFTCGNLDPRQAMTSLVRRLGGHGRGWYIERGEWREPLMFMCTAQ